MPKLLFWNLGGALRGIEAVRCAVADTTPDFIVMAEFRNPDHILPGFSRVDVGRARLLVFVRDGEEVSLLETQPHFAILRCRGGLLALAHLRSNLFNGGVLREDELRDMASALRADRHPEEWVVVAGDLNTPPYDRLITRYNIFNARQTFSEADERMTMGGRVWPHLVALGFDHLATLQINGAETAGSFHFKGAVYDQMTRPLLDHALVSPDLRHARMVLLREESFPYLEGLGSERDNRECPDHLPLVVEW